MIDTSFGIKLYSSRDCEQLEGAIRYLLSNPDEGSEFEKNLSIARDSILDEDELITALLSQGYDVLGAYSQERLVGTSAFQKKIRFGLSFSSRNPITTYEVFSVRVNENHRREGIGTFMQEELIRLAIKAGIDYVRISNSEEIPKKSRTPEQNRMSGLIRKIDCKKLGTRRLNGKLGNWFELPPRQ